MFYLDNMNITIENVTNMSEYYDSFDWAYRQRVLQEIERYEKIRLVKFIALGFIIPFGIFFNSLAFIVLLKSENLRSKPMGRLLIALSFADSSYLLGKYVWLGY